MPASDPAAPRRRRERPRADRVPEEAELVPCAVPGGRRRQRPGAGSRTPGTSGGAECTGWFGLARRLVPARAQAAVALVGRQPLRYGHTQARRPRQPRHWSAGTRYATGLFRPLSVTQRFVSLRNLSGRLALTFCPHLGTTVRDKKLGKVSLSAPRTVVCFYSATSCLPRPDDWRRVFEKGGVIGALLTSALAASVPVALHCLFFPTRSGTLDD